MDICFSADDSLFNESVNDDTNDLNISLQLTTHSLPKKTHEYMGLLLSKHLNECGLGTYYNQLNYCLSEILFNAIKANMKRIYFTEKGLDIENPEDYKKGMETFRKDTLDNRDFYQRKLRNSPYYVSYSLKIDNGKVIIEVRNNTRMTDVEAARVKEKIATFYTGDKDSIYQSSIDAVEGAGLGIRSILFTLRGFGLPGDNYQLFTEGEETVARLIVEEPPLIEI